MEPREIDLALADALDEIERLKKIIANLTENVEVIDFDDSVRGELK